MDIKKKYEIARKIATASVVATLLSGVIGLGCIGKMSYNQDRYEPEGLDDRLAYLETNGEYKAYLDSEANNLYSQLRTGEITSSKFSDEYDNLHTVNNFLKWARTLDNAEVKSIIAEYDAEIEEYNKMQSKYGYSLGASIGAAALSLIAYVQANDSEKKFEKYKVISEMSQETEQAK